MAVVGFLAILGMALFLLVQALKLIGAIIVVKQLSGGMVVGMYILLIILLTAGGSMLYAAFYWMPFAIVAGLK